MPSKDTKDNNEEFLNELFDTFNEIFGNALKIHGLNDDTMSSLMAHLYLEPDEISMDKLSLKTGYSLSTVSNKLKHLENFGMIKKYHKPGTKKIFVYMDKNFIPHMKSFLIKKQKSVINIAKEKLPKILELNKNKPNSKYVTKQLLIVKNYYSQIQKFDKFIDNIIKLINKEK